MIVPTAFAARALCEAAQVFSRDEYLPFARTICDFILNDLNRTEETHDEVCFSYSPLDRTCVFNASLLAAETLATVGKLTGEESLGELALRAALYVVRRQREDGSWAYGADDYQSWSDNFHTAFVLTSLARIIDSVPTSVATGLGEQLEGPLRRGYDFWRERFFLENGWPKYFPDRLHPADAHSAAAAIVALVDLRGRIPSTMILAEQIANWAKEHILQFMRLTTDQLDAVYEYIKENQEDVERSYERILHRSEELRSYYEAQNRARSPFPPEMPLEERRKLMLQKAAAMKASQAKNENHDPARS